MEEKYSGPITSDRYRPDIDGLRAIAVILVILFHFGFSLFQGGFVGVDIFFVISGYLITRIIYQEVQNNEEFSFSNFYLRRARRIIPALLATLFVCFLIAFTLLSPSDFKRFCGSQIASILSIGNFYFWNEAGYFDVLAETKPLLHLWSLGVEEQFYLVWPLFLVLLAKFRKGLWKYLILVISASLSLNIFFQNDIATIFYLPWFRVFEFALGAFLVVLPKGLGKSHKKQQSLDINLTQEILFILGLCLVLFSAFAFSERTVFPTYNALIPCLGAAFLINAGEARIGGLILRNPLSVGIGRISYSLYLVHWPLLVFYRYKFGSDLNLNEKWGLIAASFLLAAISYKFIETPFRKSGEYNYWRQNKKVVLFGITTALVLILPSIHSYQNYGWLWRLPFNISHIIQNTIDNRSIRRYVDDRCRSDRIEEIISGRCLHIDPGKKNILVLGDSVGEFAWHGLRISLPEETYNLLQFTPSGCNPLLKTGNERCEKVKSFLYSDMLPEGQVDLVILFSLNWPEKELEKSLSYLGSIQQKTILVETSIKFDGHLSKILSKFQPKTPAEITKIAKDHISNPTLDQRKAARKIAKKLKIKYYGVVDKLCKDEINWESCTFIEDGILLTKDNNHFTPKFSEKILKGLAEDIKNGNY